MTRVSTGRHKKDNEIIKVTTPQAICVIYYFTIFLEATGRVIILGGKVYATIFCESQDA